jgi:aspartyl-tRNA(Asn)/glutamyl-tRNA(Gln) amidotransferase subunit C
MQLDKKTVEYVAHLARMELKPQELEVLSGQLKDILGFIDKLSKLDVAGIAPTSHILPVSNIYRDDEPAGSLAPDSVTSGAPQKEGNFFAVPKIIE